MIGKGSEAGMICFDTMPLIWGVKGVARSSQTRMIDLTQRYIDRLGSSETLMVPSVAVGEYLSGFASEQQRLAQLEILSRRFFVPSFDLPAAGLAAAIAQTPSARELMEQGDRRCVKADIQIIATAIIHGAERIITGNVNEYRKLAGDRIEILDVPVIEVQTILELETPPN